MTDIRGASHNYWMSTPYPSELSCRDIRDYLVGVDESFCIAKLFLFAQCFMIPTKLVSSQALVLVSLVRSLLHAGDAIHPVLLRREVSGHRD